MMIPNMNTFFPKTISLPISDILSVLNVNCVARPLITAVPEL